MGLRLRIAAGAFPSRGSDPADDPGLDLRREPADGILRQADRRWELLARDQAVQRAAAEAGGVLHLATAHDAVGLDRGGRRDGTGARALRAGLAEQWELVRAGAGIGGIGRFHGGCPGLRRNWRGQQPHFVNTGGPHQGARPMCLLLRLLLESLAEFLTAPVLLGGGLRQVGFLLSP